MPVDYQDSPLFQGRSPSGAGFSRLTQSSEFGGQKGGGTIWPLWNRTGALS
jgi:hypothetical protein